MCFYYHILLLSLAFLLRNYLRLAFVRADLAPPLSRCVKKGRFFFSNPGTELGVGFYANEKNLPLSCACV